MMVERIWPTWSSFATFGEENSTMIFSLFSDGKRPRMDRSVAVAAAQKGIGEARVKLMKPGPAISTLEQMIRSKWSMIFWAIARGFCLRISKGGKRYCIDSGQILPGCRGPYQQGLLGDNASKSAEIECGDLRSKSR